LSRRKERTIVAEAQPLRRKRRDPKLPSRVKNEKGESSWIEEGPVKRTGRRTKERGGRRK